MIKVTELSDEEIIRKALEVFNNDPHTNGMHVLDSNEPLADDVAEELRDRMSQIIASI